MDDLISKRSAVERLIIAMSLLDSVMQDIADFPKYSDKLWKTAYERGKEDAEPEIIRCKDCRWWLDPDEPDGCARRDGLVTARENSFCSYGERMV